MIQLTVIFCIIASFLWLLIETKFLTINLNERPLTLNDLLSGVVSITIGINLFPLIK